MPDPAARPLARNIEIKARIESVEAFLRNAAIASEGPIEIQQDDTFFRCDNGRLKLRTLAGNEAEIIFYRRANQHRPKESFYLQSPTSAPAAMRDALCLEQLIEGAYLDLHARHSV